MPAPIDEFKVVLQIASQEAHERREFDTELVRKFVDLVVKAKEHGKVRAREGAGSTNEAFAHGLVQRAVRDIEKHLQP